MKLFLNVAGAAILLCTFSVANAQEIKCDQVFMNPSEKQICASEDLMRQDQLLGEMYRRTEPHVDGLKKSQREFRRGLKSCKGTHECLARSYDVRIEELKLLINSLPMATEQQIVSLEQSAEVATEERADQDDERAEIISEMAVPEDSPVDPAVAPEFVPELEPEVLAEAAPEPASPAPNSDSPWLGLVLISALCLGALTWFWLWIQKVFKRCPQCRRWSAGVVYDSDTSSHTDYETKTFTDTRRDRNNNVTGTTERQRQVAVRVVNQTDHLECKYCQNQWKQHFSSRSL